MPCHDVSPLEAGFMRKIFVVLAFVGTLIGGAAHAQDAAGGGGAGGEGGQVKTKFYNFDDMLIDGDIKKPSGLLTNARDQVKFQRLLSLKKSFLPTLKRTAKEKTLK